MAMVQEKRTDNNWKADVTAANTVVAGWNARERGVGECRSWAPTKFYVKGDVVFVTPEYNAEIFDGGYFLDGELVWVQGQGFVTGRPDLIRQSSDKALKEYFALGGTVQELPYMGKKDAGKAKRVQGFAKSPAYHESLTDQQDRNPNGRSGWARFNVEDDNTPTPVEDLFDSYDMVLDMFGDVEGYARGE